MNKFALLMLAQVELGLWPRLLNEYNSIIDQSLTNGTFRRFKRIHFHDET